MGLSHTCSGFPSTSDRKAGLLGRLKATVRQQGVGAVPGEKGNQGFRGKKLGDVGEKHLLHFVRDAA